MNQKLGRHFGRIELVEVVVVGVVVLFIFDRRWRLGWVMDDGRKDGLEKGSW